ncbi:MAG: prepilin-type N-terminal cleavage/methylation domain-containing protein [Nitrospirae bacterium]|nr:prepilin-type N-terminal cleavage/methylation domain-containing protein [Nitrospirota bacterium]
MVKRQDGFSLIELMITMVVFLLIIASASGVFTSLLTQFKQQSKVAETNIEGAIGLEILRRDLESAGYGLPWNVEVDGDNDGNDWEQLVGYCEAVSDVTITPNPTTFNNGATVAGACPAAVTAGSAPMAIRSGNNTGWNGADYLSIKSTTIATNDTAKKWNYLRVGDNKNTWTPACENLNKYPNAGAGDTDCSTGASTENTVRVIVISPGGSSAANTRSLITNAGVFFTQYSGTANFAPPAGSTETYMVYGVDRGTNLRMPFNRADYFIKVPATMPSACAPNTGILYKGTLSQANGTITELPILDCVADMQVVYALDNDEDGDFVNGEGTPADAYTDNLTGLTAAQIRTRVKEIRVYILAHEGQRDANYTYPNNSIAIPPASDPAAGLGRTFDLTIITNYQNYRWKVYTLVVRPNNLR